MMGICTVHMFISVGQVLIYFKESVYMITSVGFFSRFSSNDVANTEGA